jgi:glycosyltransferase involved in cell wall biosynthesis
VTDTRTISVQPTPTTGPTRGEVARTCGSESVGGVLLQANVYGGPAAEETRALALGLVRAGLPVQVVPRDSLQDAKNSLPHSVQAGIEGLTRQRVELARSVLYQAGSPDDWELNYYGRRRVGRAAFGAERLPCGWSERCNAMDEVWVPSEFQRETFEASGVDGEKLRVVHTGFDTETFRPGLEPLGIPCARGFRFLAFADLHPRRGTDVLLSAYMKEFQPDEDVMLLLKVADDKDSVADTEAELAFWIEKQLGLKLEETPAIVLVTGRLSHSDMPRLYASANAFVMPSRATARGRSLLEALACGLPVIATGWGGHRELLSNDNGFLIEIESLVSAAAEDERVGGLRWAEPSVDHLRRLLRQVVTNRDEAQRRARSGRENAVQQWDWKVVIPEWARAFHRLLN